MLGRIEIFLWGALP